MATKEHRCSKNQKKQKGDYVKKARAQTEYQKERDAAKKRKKGCGGNTISI